MNRHNRKRGFTMAEMLIVVAIIGVLGAVAFVAVNQHQRSLERLERDSVAKEIFVAAQNHLTMAQSQGYMGVADQTGQEEDKNKGYYFFVYPTDKYSTNGTPKTLLDLMLPYGAIDETVRGGGQYIIRYHLETATVMDVFYSSDPSKDTRYGYNLSGTTKDKLSELLTNYGNDSATNARSNADGKVLGWYGGATAESLPRTTLLDPKIDVENGDKLRVGITENNSGVGTLQIIVMGVTSNAQKIIMLKSNEEGFSLDSLDYKARFDTNKTVNRKDYSYAIILDDITTADLHFADLQADAGTGPFIPGEDIKIQAIAFDNTQISNIAYSAEITVNSLYEKLEKDAADGVLKASISSIRHLENLDKRVSNVTDSQTEGSGASAVTYKLNKAIQTSDLKWDDFKLNGEDFKEKTNAGSTGIVLYGSNAGATGVGNYLPVVPTHAFTYDGKNHSVTGVQANYANEKGAGMFDTIPDDTANHPAISNLALIDFSITQTGSGNAGALAGTLTNCTVTNVIAYNSTKRTDIGITAASGDAGGLIGSAKDCTIEKTAAAVIVGSTSGNAGGLIGTTNGGKVSGCYSGGHTNKGTYYKDDGTEIYNVQAVAKNAGGLIGLAASTPIEHCYSTCSVTGAKVGGLVGSASEKIQHSYCTGLVKSTAETPVEGAFVGAWSYNKVATDDNHYLDIINEWEIVDASNNITGYRYLDPVSGSPTVLGVSAIDDSATAYNGFCGEKAVWKPASPYDSKLVEYYGGKYNLKTIAQLGYSTVYDVDQTDADGNITAYADFVIQHYGDWPAPEIFVVNTQSSN